MRMLRSKRPRTAVGRVAPYDSSSWAPPRLLLVVWTMAVLTVAATDNDSSSSWSSFQSQALGLPYAGQHTGVATFDLNRDGYPDLLFSAGRHWVDQSFVKINLGLQDNGRFRFSPAHPIGDPGGYYQVDATRLSSLPWKRSTAVLLAGSTCTVTYAHPEYGACTMGAHEAAVLLHVVVRGCSVYAPDVPCNVNWWPIWRDANPQGNRNAAFAHSLGDGVDPALVLVGMGGISIFEPIPGEGAYNDVPDLVIPAGDAVEGWDAIDRGTGLAVGYLGNTYPGLVMGVRTTNNIAPAPLIAVYKDYWGRYDWYNFGNQDAYSGDPAKGFQPSDLAIADLNGDGFFDVVEANFLKSDEILPGHPIPQQYFLLNAEGVAMVTHKAYWSFYGGRSVAVGQIYDDSVLPDLAFGDAMGQVVLLANLGNDENGIFLGFEVRNRFWVTEGCEIRDIAVESLAPCSVSIITAIACTNGITHSAQENGNQAIHVFGMGCPFSAEPLGQPSTIPSVSPSTLPSTLPSIEPSMVPTTTAQPSVFPSTTPSSSVMPTATPMPLDRPSKVEVKTANRRPSDSAAVVDAPSTTSSSSSIATTTTYPWMGAIMTLSASTMLLFLL